MGAPPPDGILSAILIEIRRKVKSESEIPPRNAKSASFFPFRPARSALRETACDDGHRDPSAPRPTPRGRAPHRGRVSFPFPSSLVLLPCSRSPSQPRWDVRIDRHRPVRRRQNAPPVRSLQSAIAESAPLPRSPARHRVPHHPPVPPLEFRRHRAHPQVNTALFSKEREL